MRELWWRSTIAFLQPQHWQSSFRKAQRGFLLTNLVGNKKRQNPNTKLVIWLSRTSHYSLKIKSCLDFFLTFSVPDLIQRCNGRPKTMRDEGKERTVGGQRIFPWAVHCRVQSKADDPDESRRSWGMKADDLLGQSRRSFEPKQTIWPKQTILKRMKADDLGQSGRSFSIVFL